MSGQRILWNPEQAERLAKFAHAGQVDKAGEDYFKAHLVSTVAYLRYGAQIRNERFLALSEEDRETAVMVAWLHDVAEDTPVSINLLRDMGAPYAVWHRVYLLTRPHTQSYWANLTEAIRAKAEEAYYTDIAADPIALAVKEADIASNTHPARTHRLDEATRDRLAAKYAKARKALGLQDPWA